MSPESFLGGEEQIKLSPIDSPKELKKNEILHESREQLALLKVEVEESLKKNQDKKIYGENTISVGTNEKGEKIISIGVVKNEIINSQSITDSLISMRPKDANFIKKLIIPGVKITGESYREICSQLDYAFRTIDMNDGPRNVYVRQGEYRPREDINFSDPNSKNYSVQNFRRVIKELNAKFFVGQVSPFNPTLYN